MLARDNISTSCPQGMGRADFIRHFFAGVLTNVQRSTIVLCPIRVASVWLDEPSRGEFTLVLFPENLFLFHHCLFSPSWLLPIRYSEREAYFSPPAMSFHKSLVPLAEHGMDLNIFALSFIVSQPVSLITGVQCHHPCHPLRGAYTQYTAPYLSILG